MVSVREEHLECLGSCPSCTAVSLHCHLLGWASAAELAGLESPPVQEGHRAGARTGPCTLLCVLGLEQC